MQTVRIKYIIIKGQRSFVEYTIQYSQRYGNHK